MENCVAVGNLNLWWVNIHSLLCILWNPYFKVWRTLCLCHRLFCRLKSQWKQSILLFPSSDWYNSNSNSGSYHTVENKTKSKIKNLLSPLIPLTLPIVALVLVKQGHSMLNLWIYESICIHIHNTLRAARSHLTLAFSKTRIYLLGL